MREVIQELGDPDQLFDRLWTVPVHGVRHWARIALQGANGNQDGHMSCDAHMSQEVFLSNGAIFAQLQSTRSTLVIVYNWLRSTLPFRCCRVQDLGMSPAPPPPPRPAPP